MYNFEDVLIIESKESAGAPWIVDRRITGRAQVFERLASVLYDRTFKASADLSKVTERPLYEGYNAREIVAYYNEGGGVKVRYTFRVDEI